MDEEKTYVDGGGKLGCEDRYTATTGLSDWVDGRGFLFPGAVL